MRHRRNKLGHFPPYIKLHCAHHDDLHSARPRPRRVRATAIAGKAGAELAAVRLQVDRRTVRRYVETLGSYRSAGKAGRVGAMAATL